MTAAQSAYTEALHALIRRIQAALASSRPDLLPVRMYIAGGAALHFLTGERVSEDIDATFSRKVLFPEELSVAYRDSDGRARFVYLDRNYNDTLGLLHEDAYLASRRVEIPGVDRKVIDVRILAPLDLAVSKLARFGDQDRKDIESLAKAGLIDAGRLRRRAEQALQGYVGDPMPLRTSIDIACKLVEAARRRNPPLKKPRKAGPG